MQKANFRSLTVQLIMYFTLFVLTPLFLIILISYISFARDIEATAKDTIGQYSKRTVESLDLIYNQLNNLTMDMVGDKLLWEKVRDRGNLSSSNKEFELRAFDQEIEQIFTNYTSKMDGLTNIGFMTPDGQIYSSNLRLRATIFEQSSARLYDSRWYKDFISHGRVKSIYSLDNGQILYVNKVNSLNNFNQTAGFMLSELDPRIFETMFTGNVHASHSSMYIVNDSKELIYQKGKIIDFIGLIGVSANRQAEIYSGQEKYLLQTNVSSLTGWSLIELIPYKMIIGSADKLRNTSIILVVICYFISLLATILLSRRVVLPLRKIMSKMKDVGRWENEGQLEVSGPVEVRDIAFRFNFMKQEIRLLIQGIKEEQRKAKEADMAVLQAQINPHFLYNTLNLIIFLSRKQKNNEIQVLTGSLISFLQNSLKSGDLLVPLATELRMIEHYFLLHQFRMEGKIDLHMSVPHNFFSIKIPRFILQPIVENAIFHGLYPKQDFGTIIVAVTGNELEMTIKIIDDGVGIDTVKASKMRSQVGLNNVTQRLNHIYPNNGSSLKLFSISGIGTSVAVTIPVHDQRR